ncbi:hypothetical protein ANO11243_004750 [Dothideomycetidae sp. 11243]|nr:hypothetical protein ANO11243_004750 [fungal sp. No.11243]
MPFRSFLHAVHDRMSSRSPSPAGTAIASTTKSSPSPKPQDSTSNLYSRRSKSRSPAPPHHVSKQIITPPASRDTSATRPDASPQRQRRPRRRLRVQVPLYIYPTANAWEPLFIAMAAHPDLQFDIVVNPFNGPGPDALPDENYIAQMTRLRQHSNVTVYGYVHISWAERSLEDVLNDVRAYEGWNTASQPGADKDIHVDGIFVDEAPYHPRSMGYMSSLHAHIRRTLSRGALVWTNPGCPVAAAYYNHADRITAFEASFADWDERGGFLQGFEGGSKEKRKTGVMVHSCPREKVADVLATCKEEGADGVFVTDLRGYEGWGRGWAEWVRIVADEVEAAS